MVSLSFLTLLAVISFTHCWNYTKNGTDWNITECFPVIFHTQSPISISSEQLQCTSTEQADLYFNTQKTTGTIAFDGEPLTFRLKPATNFAILNLRTSEGSIDSFSPQEIVVRVPSEHALNNEHFGAEIQIRFTPSEMYSSRAKIKTIMVSILVNVLPETDQNSAFLIDYAEAIKSFDLIKVLDEGNIKVPFVPADPSKYNSDLGDNKDYLTYFGSMTDGNCDGGGSAPTGNLPDGTSSSTTGASTGATDADDNPNYSKIKWIILNQQLSVSESVLTPLKVALTNLTTVNYNRRELVQNLIAPEVLSVTSQCGDHYLNLIAFTLLYIAINYFIFKIA